MFQFQAAFCGIAALEYQITYGKKRFLSSKYFEKMQLVKLIKEAAALETMNAKIGAVVG
jgi:hypothetical protein